MNVFWSRGYHGTALPDLLRATKLSRGSLYAAFGGKHALFLRALDRYIAEGLARLDVELDPRGKPAAGLQACLSRYAERTSGASGKRGCLLVATAMELAAHDPQVERRVSPLQGNGDQAGGCAFAREGTRTVGRRRQARNCGATTDLRGRRHGRDGQEHSGPSYDASYSRRCSITSPSRYPMGAHIAYAYIWTAWSLKVQS